MKKICYNTGRKGGIHMLDRYIEAMIDSQYGTEYENAFDFTDTSYDEFHVNLNFYRVYQQEDMPLIIRMSGKNIRKTDKTVVADVLETTNFRSLTEREKEICREQKESIRIK